MEVLIFIIRVYIALFIWVVDSVASQKSKQDALYNKNLLALKFGFTMIKLEPDISLPGEIIPPDGS